MKSGIANIVKVGAGIVGVGVALKQAFDFGKQGAELEYAAGKFDRLSEAVGTTSDILLGKLRQAVKGTRSDMELMASAGDFMALGLAKSEEEVVRLTRVAGALNMNMNQLVLTLTNQTTMRFDALGVSVDGFKEKVKALEDQGMDTNAAFQEAFLQQAEAQIEKVGDAADTTLGKFNRLEASMKYIEVAAKTAFVPILADAAEALDGLLTNQGKVNDVLKAHAAQVAITSKSYAEYSDELGRAAKAAGYIMDEQGKLYSINASGQTTLIDSNYRLSLSEFKVNEARAAGILQMKDGPGLMIEYAGKVDKLALSEKELAAQTKAVTDAHSLMLSTTLDITKMNRSYDESQGKLNETIKTTEEEIGKLSDLKVLTPAQYGNLNKYWSAMKIAEQASKDMIQTSSKGMPSALSKMNSALAKVTGGPASFKTAAAAVKWYKDEVNKLADGTYLTEAQKKELDSLKGKLSDAKDEVKNLAAEFEAQTKKMIYDMIYQKVAIDGITDDEFEYLMNLGIGFGILDVKAAEAASGIIESMGGTTGSILAAWDAAQKLRGEIERIPTEKSIRINIDTINTTTTNRRFSGEVTDYASGGSFRIPEIYGYEGYPLGPNKTASGGEIVTVTPKDKARDAAAPMTINVYGLGIEDAARRIARELQRRN